MKAAQCVSADDYLKIMEWVEEVKKVAKEKCK